MLIKTILAIETSCDETSASVLQVSPRGEPRANLKVKVLSSVVYSQVLTHRKTQGVVPEVAAREHSVKIIPVIKKALLDAQIVLKQSSLSRKEFISKHIDYIAVTTNPGLFGSLMVGVETAKTLSYLYNKPIIPVNHIHGHLASVLTEKLTSQTGLDKKAQKVLFPMITLTVSGGHTNLVLSKKLGDYQIVGKTLDDAAGEAFDKIAKMLDLDYPGGVEVARIADQYQQEVVSSKYYVLSEDKRIPHNISPIIHNTDFNFPRPVLHSHDFNFSFSGLKTAVYYQLRKMDKRCIKIMQGYICYEAQKAIVEVLVAKTLKAAEKYQVKTVGLAGGVASNFFLRKKLKFKIKNLKLKIALSVAPKELCTDNATMIALSAGIDLYLGRNIKSWERVVASSN